jgi:hypothetical protein
MTQPRGNPSPSPSTGPAGLPPRSASPATKRLSKEELDKAVERLARPHTPAREPEPLPQLKPPVKLSKSDLMDSAVRLCNQAVEHKARSVAALEERLLMDPRPKSSLSHDELDASVQRLYVGAVRAAQQKHEALRSKLLFIPPPKDADKAKVDHSIQSLYYQQKERDAERRKKLLAKYVEPTGPKHGRISGEQISRMVERLGTPVPK